jgi:hypothetical protein
MAKSYLKNKVLNIMYIPYTYIFKLGHFVKFTHNFFYKCYKIWQLIYDFPSITNKTTAFEILVCHSNAFSRMSSKVKYDDDWVTFITAWIFIFATLMSPLFTFF